LSFSIAQRREKGVVLYADLNSPMSGILSQRDFENGKPGRASGPQAALSGSKPKAPGFAGGYLPEGAPCPASGLARDRREPDEACGLTRFERAEFGHFDQQGEGGDVG
jgi:hypothetical protein